MARGLFIGLFAGLLVGLGVGWVVFDTSVSSPKEAEGPERGGAAQDAPAETTLASRPHLSGIQAREEEPKPPAPADVERVRGRLATAAASADWVTARTTLDALGAANTPEADALLVETLGNSAVAFPEPMGEAFLVWLEGTEVGGVSEAVRRRIPADVSSLGVPKDLVLRDWARVLGAHGTQDDLDWLVDNGHAEHAPSACRALLESRRPAGLYLARHLVRTRYDRPRPRYMQPGVLDLAFDLLAETDPAWVRPHLEVELDRRIKGPTVFLSPHRALPLFVRTFSCGNAAGAHARILELFREGTDRGSPVVRAALLAVRQLHEDGCDVAPLQEILDWPAESILRGAPRRGDDSPTGGSWELALSLLQAEPLLWTERAVEALEAALPYQQEYPRLRMLQRIQQIRRHLQRKED